VTDIKSLRDKARDGGSVDDVLGEVIAARRAGSDPKDLFGGPRDWVDSAVPPAALGLTYTIAKLSLDHHAALRLAIVAALVAEAGVIVARLLRRETLRHALSGAFGAVVVAVLIWKTGNPKNIALPGILINAAYATAFAASVAFRHPLVGVVMRLVSDKPKAYHEHPRVRRAYAELTLIWAASFALRAGVQEVLRREAPLLVVVIGKIVTGYPLYVAVLALSMPYLKRRTRDVPVPESAPEEAAEAEAEPGGEHAGADAP
jgi:intracellular septation protein A